MREHAFSFLVLPLLGVFVFVIVQTLIVLIKHKRGKVTPNAQDSAEQFTVEFYPKTERYYAKHGKYYLKRDYSTGIIRQLEPQHFMWATWQRYETGAWDFIGEYKELQLKSNVKTLTEPSKCKQQDESCI